MNAGVEGVKAVTAAPPLHFNSEHRPRFAIWGALGAARHPLAIFTRRHEARAVPCCVHELDERSTHGPRSRPPGHAGHHRPHDAGRRLAGGHRRGAHGVRLPPRTRKGRRSGQAARPARQRRCGNVLPARVRTVRGVPRRRGGSLLAPHARAATRPLRRTTHAHPAGRRRRDALPGFGRP